MRYNWKELNRQQKGTYCEYLAKMEFTLAGFQVYTSEVDDRGIDFVVRHEEAPFYEVQVKATGETANPFVYKDKFKKMKTLYCVV